MKARCGHPNAGRRNSSTPPARPYCCVLAEFDGDTRHAETCRYTVSPRTSAVPPQGEGRQ